MRHLKSWLLLPLLLSMSACDANETPPTPQADAGRIERIEGSVPAGSALAPRAVDVWLPSNYPQQAPYAVIWAHDGQMLFDAATTWNQQAWEFDRIGAELIEAGAVRPLIVIGVHNGGERRHAEFYPQAVLAALTEAQRAEAIEGEPAADAYLDYLLQTLRPLIAARYAVSTEPQDQFLLGSSMGGLISLYGLLRDPQHWGGAAAVSTHWPGSEPKPDAPFALAFRAWIAGRLPELSGQRIWMDHGTETLDAHYPPLQAQADRVFEASKLSRDQWTSREYTGTDHSEKSWSGRLADPLRFLLAPVESAE
jgi:enterochelin esterase-like enzyme